MVHGVALSGGECRWYRNRYVRTPLHAHPGTERVALAYDASTGAIDHEVTTANTHVVAHAGRLLALEEGGYPYELTPSLETVGPFTFDGALSTPMTAHPKTCPVTGDLLFFGTQLRPPFLTVYRATGAAGALVESVPIDLAVPSMMHDFAITESSVVLFDSPIVFDARAVASGGPPWRWDDGHGARFGVLPRGGSADEIRWFDVDPCHLSHSANAHDDGDEIVVTGTRIASSWRAGAADMSGDLPVLHEWRIDRRTGSVRERALDDATVEYPRVPDAAVGRPSRWCSVVSFVMEAEPDHSELHRYDLDAGTRTTHRFPRGHTCGEAVFVPGGGDGYLVAFAHDRGAGTSYLVIIDAADVAADPVAEVHLPVRVPAGFHGSWVPG
jgi:carotenoid cleavage dioxygenase